MPCTHVHMYGEGEYGLILTNLLCISFFNWQNVMFRVETISVITYCVMSILRAEYNSTTFGNPALYMPRAPCVQDV